ncbi:MAG: MipA/OmpV family protein [Sphingomicrobium sp.]
MKHSLIASAAAVSVILLPGWSAAWAQENRDLRVRVGLGAQLRPAFVGADDRDVSPLVDVDIARGTNPFRFEAEDDSFAIPLISKNGFSAGPAANLSSKRKESDVGAPLGKIPRTFEAGVFAEQFFGGESFRLRGELLKGIGGHEGLIGSVGADKVWRNGDKYVFSVGPRLLFSNARYQRAYFGVDSDAALASGLPVYRPDGGVHALGLASGLTYELQPRWGLFGFARYERLVGDAAKSPVVRELGSRNQVSAGAGLSYTFTIRR